MTTLQNQFCMSNKQNTVMSRVFTRSVYFVIKNTSISNLEKVLSFLSSTVAKEKPYMLVTTEGVEHAIDVVFTDEVIRDFIFTLHATFMTRWSHDSDMYNSLLSNIASGVGIGGYKKDSQSAIPSPLNERLLSAQDAYTVLKDNNWLVMLILICVHVDNEFINNINKH